MEIIVYHLCVDKGINREKLDSGIPGSDHHGFRLGIHPRILGCLFIIPTLLNMIGNVFSSRWDCPFLPQDIEDELHGGCSDQIS